MPVRVLTSTVRSGPIYLTAGEKVISLVVEASVRELRLKAKRTGWQWVAPSAVYVIDERGVHQVRFPLVRIRPLIFAATFAALVWMFLRRTASRGRP